MSLDALGLALAAADVKVVGQYAAGPVLSKTASAGPSAHQHAHATTDETDDARFVYGDDDGDANNFMVPGPSDEESDTSDRSGGHDAIVLLVAPYWFIDSSGVLHTPDDLFDQLLYEIIKEIEALDNPTRAPGERAARALCLFDTIAAIGIYMPEDIPLMLFAPALARTRFDAEFDSEFNPPDPQLASTWDQVEYIAERLDVSKAVFQVRCSIPHK